MTIKTAILLIFVTLISFKSLYSQPAGTVQLVGGYSVPVMDYHGTFGEKYEQFTFGGNPDSNTYFMKGGINYGLLFKFPISRKALPYINVTGSIFINGFGQDKRYTVDTGYIEVDLTQNVTSFGLGVEYNGAGKKTVINPYFGLEFTLNLFSGSFVDYRSKDDVTSTYRLVNTIRGGIKARAGIDYVLHNNVGVNVGASFAFANLFGKNAQQDVSPEYYLNDAERTDQGVKYPARNITYMQFFGGVSFYFGR